MTGHLSIRLLRDNLGQESWPGAYVNTNKTALYNGERRGYEIPYLPPELVTLLAGMRRWNQRFLLPLPGLVTYREEGKERSRLVSSIELKLPKIAPLFRDPRSPQRNRPPSSSKVASLWLRVLQETEGRIFRERGQKLALTKIDEAGKRTWRFDLHTLRVSGISAMIENGVPLEVVSQFIAGHATLVMTMWYFKLNPGKLREEIERAHERAIAEGDFIGSVDFAEHLEKFTPFLLSKNAIRRLEGEDVAFAALKQQTGIWSISSDGICPGTSCATGGEVEDGGTTYGPVPGGRRCGLCRYWITGPAFLLGQMAEANNLIYSIRKKGLELKDARDTLIEYEDAGKVGRVREMRSRIEMLERELELDLVEWQARYNYAITSSGLLDDYVKTRNSVIPEKNLPAPLITANSEVEWKLTLQESDEFVLLEHLTQMGNVMPGYKNREATMEKHAILSKILVNNGLQPFLLNMESKQAEVAGNLLSSMLLEYVSSQDRERLIAGKMMLDEISGLDKKVKKLVESVTNEGSGKGLTGKVIPIRQAK